MKALRFVLDQILQEFMAAGEDEQRVSGGLGGRVGIERA